MEKKNNNIGVIAVLAVLLIAVLAFGVWAWSKYTETLPEIKGASASVAKWDFGTTTTLDNLNLASLSFNDVTDKKIAPGTHGSFDVTVSAGDSDVSINYDVELLNMQNKPKNLHFYTDTTYADDTKVDTSTGAKYTGTISVGDTSKTKTVTIYWNWPYETGTTTEEKTANDTQDTTDGKAAANITFDLKITGTQVQPTTK